METDNAQNQNNAPASVDVNQPATQPEQALGEPAAQPMGEAPAPEAMEQQQNEENRAGDGATAKRRKSCRIESPLTTRSSISNSRLWCSMSETPANEVLEQWKVFFKQGCSLNDARANLYAHAFSTEVKKFDQLKTLYEYLQRSDDLAKTLSQFVPDATAFECIAILDGIKNFQWSGSRPTSQDEPPIVDCCRDYMLYSLISETAPGVFENGLIKNCVTVATSQFAFMAGHCLPKGLPENTTFQVYSRKNEPFDVRLVLVKRYDESGDDFGIIEIQKGSFPHYPPATTLPEAGVSYFILGYDAEYPSVDHLSCFKGTFRNTQIYSSRNYVIGSPGTTSGCSGAGVFSMSGTLYGICVSGRLEIGSTFMTLNSHLQTLQTKLSEPSYSHIIPACYLFALIPDRKRKREQAED